jgi:hypothetical protein
LENKNLTVEIGPSKEKDIDCSLGMSQLEGTTMAVASVEHEVHRKAGIATSFPAVERFEPISQATKLDIGSEWNEVFEWPEWEDDGTLNKDNGYSLLSEHDFQLLFPSSESQIIQSNRNNIGNTKETLKHHSRTAAFGNGDANISLDTIFPEQIENNSSLHYTTPQFGFSGNFTGTGYVQEQAPTAMALEMNPQPSKCGEQRDSGMLPEINISDSFAEHLSSTDRDHDDRPAAPSPLRSLPTRPTTLGG